jgi:hypothetical protein
MSINIAVWFNRIALMWMLAATPLVVARAGKFDCGSDLMPATSDFDVQVSIEDLASEEPIDAFEITLIEQAWPRRSEVVEHPALPAAKPVVVASIDPRVGSSPLLFTIGEEYQSYDMAQSDIDRLNSDGELWNTVGLPERPFCLRYQTQSDVAMMPIADPNADHYTGEDISFDAQSLAMIDVVEAQLAGVLGEISDRRVVENSFIAGEKIASYIRSIDFDNLPIVGRYIAVSRSVAKPVESSEERRLVEESFIAAEKIGSYVRSIDFDNLPIVGRYIAVARSVAIPQESSAQTSQWAESEAVESDPASPEVPADQESDSGEEVEEEKIVDAAARSLLARAEAVEATDVIDRDNSIATTAPTIAERTGNSRR